MMLRWRRARPGTVPALFLHIQKTAGTSLIHLARQFYGTDMTSHGDWAGRDPEQFHRIRFVSGHMGYEFARHLIKDRFSFTFLREPAERILSMYYFCRGRNPSEFEIYRRAQEQELPEFLSSALSEPFLRTRIWNNQVWQLAHGYTHLNPRTVDDFSETELLRLARKHLQEFSFVGFTESFDAGAATVMDALALPPSGDIPRLNDVPGRPRFSEVSTEVRTLIERLSVLDRELYDYARTLPTAHRPRHYRRAW